VLVVVVDDFSWPWPVSVFVVDSVLLICVLLELELGGAAGGVTIVVLLALFDSPGTGTIVVSFSFTTEGGALADWGAS
jgi:hypothetical protein